MIAICLLAPHGSVNVNEATPSRRDRLADELVTSLSGNENFLLALVKDKRNDGEVFNRLGTFAYGIADATIKIGEQTAPKK